MVENGNGYTKNERIQYCPKLAKICVYIEVYIKCKRNWTEQKKVLNLISYVTIVILETEQASHLINDIYSVI